MVENFLRLGIAGLRGMVGRALNPQVTVDYVSALGTYLSGGSVAVGCDTRFSSPELKHAAMSALMACGCDVIDVGIAPAPLMHFVIPHLKVSGGVLIGAGHHLAGWNAIVPLNERGAYFNRIQTQSLLALYHSRIYRKVGYDQVGKVYRFDPLIIQDYLGLILSQLNVERIKKANFKIVADFCNGSGSLIGQQLADLLGLEMIVINNELSGYLPHEPEPRPRAGNQVRALISPLKADIGFVLNSDASRVSIVTNRGETLSEELTYPLIASHILSKSHSPCSIVTNIRSTRKLDDIGLKFNAVVEKTDIGQAPIVEKTLEVNARLGGDGSGSVVFEKGVNGYDGFMILGTILEAMAEKESTSSRLADDLPFYYIVKKSLRYHSTPYQLSKKFSSCFKDANSYDETDGLRFDWKDGWVHIRVALTEPVIRIIAEWIDKEGAENLVNRVVALAERKLLNA